MKRIAVILLSFVLVYGGVAWVGKCLSHDRQHEHSIEAHDSHSHSATTLNDSRDASWPVIHCPPAEMQIGPAAQSGSTQLTRLYRVSTVHALSFHKPESLTFGRGLWLDAVFRRAPAFLYPDDLGRHLFFSILQI